MKEKLKSGIPRHIIEKKFNSHGRVLTESRNFDVEKIMTSDDLINILEDDYKHENHSKRIRLDGEDIDGVFEIPKIDMCEEIEYLDEHEPINIDEYLKTIVSTMYVQDDNYSAPIACSVSWLIEIYFTRSKTNFLSFSPQICSEKLFSHHQMMHHISDKHTINLSHLCIFNAECATHEDLEKMQDHIFSTHFDQLP